MTLLYQSVRLSAPGRREAADGCKVSGLKTPRCLQPILPQSASQGFTAHHKLAAKEEYASVRAASAAPVHLQCHLPGERE